MKFKNEGKLIRSYREASGLTQGEVTKKLGYTSPQYLSNQERGLSAVPDKKINALCATIKMPVKVLMRAKLNARKQELEQATGIEL